MNENKDYRPEDEGAPQNGAREDDFYGSTFREYESAEPSEVKENRYTYDATVTDPTRPRTMGYSVASLILGILSIVLCCTTYGALVLGVLAIVFAVVSKKHLGYFDTMSLLGLIFGIFGFLFGLVLLVGVVWLSLDETWQQMLEQMEQGGGSDLSGSF